MAQIPPQNYWTIGSGITSLSPVFFGLSALLRPNWFYDTLQVTPPKEPEARKLADAQVLMFGARNIAVGLACLSAWYSGNQQTMGLILLGTLPMAVIDGYAAQMAAGKGAWTHWSFVPVVAGLGLGCLGWF